MPPTALDTAIKDAVADATKTEPESETKIEVKATQVEELTPQQIKERDALRLYEALEDPNISSGVIKELARRAGIIGVEEGKTEKQVTKTVVDVLKESLGAEYEFLADRLAGGISQIVNNIFEEKIKPIQAQTAEAIERSIIKETDASFDKFYTKYPDGKEHDKEMTELSKKMPFDGTYPVEEYLENLYKIVTSDKKEAKVIEKTVNKINKNARDVRDASTEVPETKVVKGSKLPTLNEAIAAAFRGEKLV